MNGYRTYERSQEKRRPVFELGVNYKGFSIVSILKYL